MQKSVRTPTDNCFARCAQLKEYVSQTVWALFLLRYVSTKHTTLCWWVSFIILLLDAFWCKPRKIEIKPVAICSWKTCQPDRDKFKRLVTFHAGIASGPLSFGLVHGFCPSSCSCMAVRVAPTFQAGNGLASAYTC